MSTVAAEQALALPTEARSIALLQLSEDQWFDRKSSRISARDLADALIGFADRLAVRPTSTRETGHLYRHRVVEVR